jgi:hypothetical protein
MAYDRRCGRRRRRRRPRRGRSATVDRRVVDGDIRRSSGGSPAGSVVAEGPASSSSAPGQGRLVTIVPAVRDRSRRRPVGARSSSNETGRHRRTRRDAPRCAADARSRRPRARRTSSITARTSAAEPPSEAWMKLACFSDTCAVPIRSPRSPSPSMSPPAATSPGHRVDEHRPAVLTAGLVLSPPADDLGDLGLGRARGRRHVAARAGRSTTWRVGQRRGPEPQGRANRRHRDEPATATDPGRTPGRRGGDAAMSDPCPPAFMRTAPPIEPGTPTAHSNPVTPAAAVRRASTGSGTPPPATTSRAIGCVPCSRSTIVDVVRELGDRDGEAANPASATSMFEPRPITSTAHRWRSHLGDRRRDRRATAPRRTGPPHPPTRYVVSGASGTSRAARSPSAAEQLAPAARDAVVAVARGDRRHVPSSHPGHRRCRHRCPSGGEHLVGQRRDVTAAHRDAHVAGAHRPRGTRRGRRAAAATPRGCADGRRARR